MFCTKNKQQITYYKLEKPSYRSAVAAKVIMNEDEIDK